MDATTVSPEQLTPLDSVCARYGFELGGEQVTDKTADSYDRVITKALGVLQEDGVFAFFLFLASVKEGSEAAKVVSAQAYSLLCDKHIDLLNTPATDTLQRLKAVLPLTESLEDLMFAKDLLERMLVYARYKAKAMGKK